MPSFLLGYAGCQNCPGLYEVKARIEGKMKPEERVEIGSRVLGEVPRFCNYWHKAGGQVPEDPFRRS
jgi:hypothetical protein